MEITLSDNQVIEILAVDFAKGLVDWKRKDGYTGACVAPVTITSLETAETEIKAALEVEVGL